MDQFASSPKKRLASPTPAELRLQKDLDELSFAKFDDCATRLSFPNGHAGAGKMTFRCTMMPSVGLWAGGSFCFEVAVPQSYPHAAPAVRAISPLLHPNVDPESSVVVLPLLGKQWKPILSINSVLLAIQLVFREAWLDGAANVSAARLAVANPDAWARTVYDSVHSQGASCFASTADVRKRPRSSAEADDGGIAAMMMDADDDDDDDDDGNAGDGNVYAKLDEASATKKQRLVRAAGMKRSRQRDDTQAEQADGDCTDAHDDSDGKVHDEFVAMQGRGGKLSRVAIDAKNAFFSTLPADHEQGSMWAQRTAAAVPSSAFSFSMAPTAAPPSSSSSFLPLSMASSSSSSSLSAPSFPSRLSTEYLAHLNYFSTRISPIQQRCKRQPSVAWQLGADDSLGHPLSSTSPLAVNVSPSRSHLRRKLDPSAASTKPCGMEEEDEDGGDGGHDDECRSSVSRLSADEAKVDKCGGHGGQGGSQSSLLLRKSAGPDLEFGPRPVWLRASRESLQGEENRARFPNLALA